MAKALDERRALVDELKRRIAEELEGTRRRALDAAEAVIHEDNRPENDKDMRSTEASYVARGQAMRVQELEVALGRLAGMPVRVFGAGEAVEASALVEVREGKAVTRYLMVTAGGGEKLKLGRTEILALGTTSPLGAALLGLTAGEEAELPGPRGARVLEVVRVS